MGLLAPVSRRPGAGPFCITLLGLLCSTAAILPARAQDAAATTTALSLPQITVEGDSDSTDVVATDNTSGSKMKTDALDSSASVSVVTAKEMQERGVSTMEQALAYSAGVVTDEWGNGDNRYDYYRIRGFDEMSLGSYRDGLPVRGFGWTFPRREPYAYDRVEVLKGSNSSLFGLNAPGGMVNAVTKTPKPYRFGEAYVTGGQDHQETGVDFGDVLNKSGTLSYRVTAKWQDAGGSYDHAEDDRRFLQAGLTWAPDANTSLTFVADYNKRDGDAGSGIPTGSGLSPKTFLGEPDFNKVDTLETGAGWQFRHDFDNGLTFRQNARYTYFKMNYQDVYGASLDPTADRESFQVQSHSDQFAIDNQLEYDGEIGTMKSRTLGGIEYTWIKVYENDQYGSAGPIDIYNPSYCGRSCVTLNPYINWQPEQKTTAAYAQEELTIADRWIVTFGGRYDYVDMHAYYPDDGSSESNVYTAFTKRAGLTYKATDNLSFYGNYSESFAPDIWSISDKPTDGTQYEVGVKYRPAGTRALLTASLFDLTQTNVSTLVGPSTYKQIGEVRVKGVELEAKAEMIHNLDLVGSYSYWDSEITKAGDTAGTEGNRPAFVPENIASLWLNYKIEGRGRVGDTTLGVGARYVGSSYSDDANTSKIDAHTVYDLAASYQITPKTQLSMAVRNLFNKDYVTASYYGTDYYGDGREITATLSYRW